MSLDAVFELKSDVATATGYAAGPWDPNMQHGGAPSSLVVWAAERIPSQGDASTRSYERLLLHPGSAILMNSPRQPDGPPIRDGKPYSAIAHLAEDVKPFVALARALRERGFGAPELYAADIDNGLLLLEDLGVDGMMTRSDPPVPIEHLYASAIDVLVALHTQELPSKLPVSPRIEHVIPPYDLDAFAVEIELMLDWYLPYRGAPRPTTGRCSAGASRRCARRTGPASGCARRNSTGSRSRSTRSAR